MKHLTKLGKEMRNKLVETLEEAAKRRATLDFFRNSDDYYGMSLRDTLAQTKAYHRAYMREYNEWLALSIEGLLEEIEEEEKRGRT